MFLVFDAVHNLNIEEFCFKTFNWRLRWLTRVSNKDLLNVS
jgi:hypothetical protein